MPQEFINVDKEKVLKQGVALTDVYNTIQANMGGLFVNYYNDFGRTWQVYVEAEAPYRATTDNLGQFYVRNNQGETVPLSALAKFETRSGPEFTMRYNEYRSAQINAQRRARLQLRSGNRGPGRCFQANDAPRNGLRLHRHVLPGAKVARGSTAFGHLRIFASVRFSDPGSAL